ncbi:MAG: hypothetical protein HY754_10640 [Nitrospirae bacterium]|nr:hypothetical protein [Nitrospirota bacterium]
MGHMVEKYETQTLIRKQLEPMVGARWRDREELIRIVKKQDRIRERLTKKLKPSDSTEFIRKWRDGR